MRVNLNYHIEQSNGYLHMVFFKLLFHKNNNVKIIVYEMLCEDSSIYSKICNLIEIEAYFTNSNYKCLNKG